MDVSFIIVNYNTKGLLKYCLKGIERANLQLSYEVIVVDNASRDGSVSMVQKEFPWVQCIANQGNVGFAAGNNIGIRHAQGNYVVIMNPDIMVLQGSIETMVHYLEVTPDGGIVGPQLVNPDKSIQYSCAKYPSIMTPLYRRTILGRTPRGQKAIRDYLMLEDPHTKVQHVDWLLGACLMAPLHVITKVGLLDERFFLYFEDIDWCRRFALAGYKVVYLPTARMVHYHRRLSANERGIGSLLSFPMRVHIMSGIKYFWKYRKNIIP